MSPESERLADGLTVSASAALGMLGVFVLGCVLLAIAIFVSKSAHRATGPTRSVVAGVLVGFAGMCVFLFACAFRQFGGSEPVGDGPTSSACAAWYLEITSAHGIDAGNQVPYSPACKSAAEQAVLRAVIEAGVTGVAIGALGSAVIDVRRRHFSRRLKTATASG